MPLIGGDNSQTQGSKLAPSGPQVWVPTTPLMHGHGLGAPGVQVIGAKTAEPFGALPSSPPHATSTDESTAAAATAAAQRITARISTSSTRERRPP
jgi:hypothetical protein